MRPLQTRIQTYRTCEVKRWETRREATRARTRPPERVRTRGLGFRPPRFRRSRLRPHGHSIDRVVATTPRAPFIAGCASRRVCARVIASRRFRLGFRGCHTGCGPHSGPTRPQAPRTGILRGGGETLKERKLVWWDGAGSEKVARATITDNPVEVTASGNVVIFHGDKGDIWLSTGMKFIIT